MTVPSPVNKVVGSGNGVTTVWPFAFKVYADSHLQVIYTSAAGADTVLDPSVYVVARNADQNATPGGTVTYTPAIAASTKLTILRVVPFTQDTDIPNQGGFFPEVIEQRLDLMMMATQQLVEEVARALKLSPAQSTIGDLEATDAARAGLVIGFDGSGNLTLLSGGASATVSAAMIPVVAAASLALARTAMGLGSLATLSALVDNTVTLAKLVDVTGPVFLGRITATSGPRSDLTPTQALAGLLATTALQTQGVNALMAGVKVFSKEVIGLTYSNNAGDAANDLDHAAGACADSTGVAWGTLAAMTKRSDATWTAGNNGGALDTGAVGNNQYWIHTVINPTTGASDVLYSLSRTAPTMTLPTAGGFTLFRVTGWFRRLAAAIIPLKTNELSGGGLEYREPTKTLDISSAATVTSGARTLFVLPNVPLGISVVLDVTFSAVDAAVSVFTYLTCPDDVDQTGDAAQGRGHGRSFTTAAFADGARVRTDTSGRIGVRADPLMGAGTMDNFFLSVMFWEWSRR